MTTIQTMTLGSRVRYRLKRGRRELLLISDKPLDPPSIFPGCPVPPAPGGGDPDGYGTRWRKVRPADPAQAGLADAGFVEVADSWMFYPSQCAAGADLVIPLDCPALDWDEYQDSLGNPDGLLNNPMGMRFEVELNRHLFAADDSAPPQSYWFGLADAAGDTVLALGWLGERERTSLDPGLGFWARYNGVDIMRDMLISGASGLKAGYAQADLTLTRVSGGVAGRRGVHMWSDHPANAESVNNFFNSMDPLSPTHWNGFMGKLRAGELRPSLIITHRAGGAVPTDRLDFLSYRIG